MKNQKNIQFIPSHYARCINKYEIDLTNGCNVRCCYCSLKNTKWKVGMAFDEIPLDIKEKGVYLSPNSDPFSKIARNTAHEILDQFLPQGVPFLIITKNKIPKKTVDLLARHPSQVYVQISISRLDDSLNSYIEPGAASASERLQTIKELVTAGIRVTPVLMPLFPMIDDTPKKISAIVNACANVGAKYLKASYVIINPYDLEQIQRMMFHLLLNESLLQMTEEVKIHIGGGLTVRNLERMSLYRRLTQLCTDHGMHFQACPILDPAVLDVKDIPICATYRKKN